jgi:hypothetical protein
MLIKQRVLLAKIEGVYRTDSLPVSTNDAVLVIDPQWGYEGLRMHDTESVRTSIAKMQKIYGGTLKTVTFSLYVKGSGVAGVAPEFDAFLQSAALEPAVVVSTSVTYSPISAVADHKSITVHFFDAGTVHKLLGTKTVALSFDRNVGEPDKLNVTVVGHPENLADEVLPVPTYDTVTPKAAVGIPFSIDGYNAVISSLSLDFGLQVSQPPDISKNNGYGEIRIIGREITGSFDPEHTLVATNDWEGDLRSGKKMVLNGGILGNVAGNRHQIMLPSIYYTEMSPEDKEGVVGLGISFHALEENGIDNEFSLAFT